MDIINQSPSVHKRQGFIDSRKVKVTTFATISICIITSVISCILAIWNFTKQDTLWQTIATCAVIAGGMMAFGIINVLYGPKE